MERVERTDFGGGNNVIKHTVLENFSVDSFNVTVHCRLKSKVFDHSRGRQRYDGSCHDGVVCQCCRLIQVFQN